MAKVRIGGEVFEYDFDRMPLADALALEEALQTPYGQWSSDRQAGKARAAAGLIWLIWRRNGRDVDFADIESGKVPVDLADFVIEDVIEDPGEDTGEAPGPTPSPSGQEASPTTGTSTSARSRKS